MFKIDIHLLNTILSTDVDLNLQKILAKALAFERLSLQELVFLLRLHQQEHLEKLYETAHIIKQVIFGDTITFFAPLYISNECVNECVYCAFRIGNKQLVRKTLTPSEIVQQAEFLAQRGFRKIQLVFGEHPNAASIDFIIQCVERIQHYTPIKDIIINCAPLSIDQFKELAKRGITQYQVYQETYDSEVYSLLHTRGPKRIYKHRLEVMDRALLGGMQQLGLGVLLGLADPRVDILALITHARHLEDIYRVKIASLSVPRLRPAHGSVYSTLQQSISDEAFKKIIAVLRLAFPYAHISISTREQPALRDALMHIGISKMSAESKTNPGGYGKEDQRTGEQFVIEDTRTLEEINERLREKDMVAVF